MDLTSGCSSGSYFDGKDWSHASSIASPFSSGDQWTKRDTSGANFACARKRLSPRWTYRPEKGRWEVHFAPKTSIRNRQARTGRATGKCGFVPCEFAGRERTGGGDQRHVYWIIRYKYSDRYKLAVRSAYNFCDRGYPCAYGDDGY